MTHCRLEFRSPQALGSDLYLATLPSVSAQQSLHAAPEKSKDLEKGMEGIVSSKQELSSGVLTTNQAEMSLTPVSDFICQVRGKCLSQLYLQGGFFNWSALKMTKCQITCKSLQKSSKCQNFLRVWHLVILRADQLKKPPCNSHLSQESRLQ